MEELFGITHQPDLKHLFQPFQSFHRFAEPVLSNVEGFKSLNITESVPAVPIVPAVPVGELVPVVPVVPDVSNVKLRRVCLVIFANVFWVQP